MAPLPVNSTARLVVDYLYRGRTFTTLYRLSDSTTLTSFITDLDAGHLALRAFFVNTWSVPGTATFYDALASVGTPVEIAAVVAGLAGTDSGITPDALQFEAVGRTLGGRRVSYYFQGLAASLNARQRTTAGVDGATAGLLDFLETLIGSGVVGIDGGSPLLKQYVNQVYNDYLTRKARGG